MDNACIQFPKNTLIVLLNNSKSTTSVCVLFFTLKLIRCDIRKTYILFYSHQYSLNQAHFTYIGGLYSPPVSQTTAKHQEHI